MKQLNVNNPTDNGSNDEFWIWLSEELGYETLFEGLESVRDVNSSGKVFPARGPATVKDRLPTADSMTSGWSDRNATATGLSGSEQNWSSRNRPIVCVRPTANVTMTYQ